jgi:hypothetical protein
MLGTLGCRPTTEEAAQTTPFTAPSADDPSAIDQEPGSTGILITAPAGTKAASWDLFIAGSESPLSRAHGTETPVAVEPGTYTVTEYFNAKLPWASGFQVEQGQLTRIHLGAVRVTAPEGTKATNWDLWDAGGENKIDEANGTGEVYPVPAGTFTVKEYFNPRLVWAQAVEVVPGRISEVRLGALHVIAPEGAKATNWDLWQPNGESKIDEANSNGEIIPVPAGSFQVNEYFNPHFVWADAIEVQPGVVTELVLGAIRVDSTTTKNWDLWDAGNTLKIDEANDTGDVVPAPAGTFTVRKYFEDDVIAHGVVVTAGEITVVQAQ